MKNGIFLLEQNNGRLYSRRFDSSPKAPLAHTQSCMHHKVFIQTTGMTALALSVDQHRSIRCLHLGRFVLKLLVSWLYLYVSSTALAELKTLEASLYSLTSDPPSYT